MTASQSRKSARRARRLSTGHGRARPDIQPSSQIVRQFTAFDATRRSFMQPLHRRTSLLDRLDSNHTPHPRHSNPHSACRAALRSPTRGFLPWRFADAGPVRAAPPSWGRHPKTFTEAVIPQSHVLRDCLPA